MNEADKIEAAATHYVALILMESLDDAVEAARALRSTIEQALLAAYADGRKDERAEHFPGVDIDAVHRRADLVRQQGTG